MPASERVARGRRPPRLGHRIKRWLYITHRWIGIVTCLLFATWFVSGLVMIYVPYPSLSTAERIARLAPIGFGQVRIQPKAAALTAGIAVPEAVVLEMRADRAVWRIRRFEGDEIVVAADDGRRLGLVERPEAERIAARFGRTQVARIERIERDQWTVAGGYNRHRPLWKATLAGPGGRIAYVSSRTGAVVLVTNARQRFWNWLGSIPHWIYPTVLRQDNALWRQVVMWVSGPCILGAITGMWIGLLRVRLGRRRFANGHIIPYHGWMAWHHVAGLFGGIALLGWIFSGWLSVDPFRLFAGREVTLDQRLAFAGAAAPPSLDLAAIGRAAAGARQIELSWAAGRPLLAIKGVGSPAHLLDARSLRPARLDPTELVAAGRHLVPEAPLRSVQVLRRPDAYWYAIDAQPTLPVLRLRFDDPARTWVHLDPRTGAFVGELDRKRRVYRWAFDFLHKWDLNALIDRRPAWDILLWGLSMLGLVTSITAICIAWRRLTRARPRPGLDGFGPGSAG